MSNDRREDIIREKINSSERGHKAMPQQVDALWARLEAKSTKKTVRIRMTVLRAAAVLFLLVGVLFVLLRHSTEPHVVQQQQPPVRPVANIVPPDSKLHPTVIKQNRESDKRSRMVVKRMSSKPTRFSRAHLVRQLENLEGPLVRERNEIATLVMKNTTQEIKDRIEF